MQKAEINARELRDTLLSREVALNPPALPATLARLTQWAGGTVHPDILAVLHEFDGFASDDFDAESFVRVWPVQKALADDRTMKPVLAFADWSLDAFTFGLDPVHGGPIINLEPREVIAPTYADFWSLLLADRLFDRRPGERRYGCLAALIGLLGRGGAAPR